MCVCANLANRQPCSHTSTHYFTILAPHLYTVFVLSLLSFCFVLLLYVDCIELLSLHIKCSTISPRETKCHPYSWLVGYCVLIDL